MDIEEETKNEQEESKLGEERRMTDADLKNELVLLKKKVEGIEKPAAAFPVRILSPSIKDKNLKMKTFDEQIEKLPEHCKNFSIDLKENFETDDKITNRLGIKLGKCLADIIKEDQSRKTTKEEEPNARVARSLIEHLGKQPVHVRCIGSEVSLCGYMYKENEQWRELYFWNGKADAIGWDKKNEKFVIVEWKVKEANESKDVMAFKPFQFQSLVYAKLLKLLLELKYLPSILIVLIDGQSGKKVHAGFFEAPDSLGDEYVWSDRKPELTIEIQPGSLFHEGLNEGEVREDMPLSKLFSDNATLEDLQKFFKTPPLKVIPKRNNV